MAMMTRRDAMTAGSSALLLSACMQETSLRSGTRSSDQPARRVLWAANVRTKSLADRLTAARAGGFTHMSVFPIDWKMWRQAGLSVNTLRSMMRDAGIKVLAVDPFVQWITELEFIEIGGGELDDAETAIDSIRAEIAAIVERAGALPDDDPKLARLVEIITQKAEMPNRRLLLFSSFRHTLSYVEAALRARGVRVGLIHGGVADDDRRRLRKAFALPPEHDDAIDVLLSSEVGSEGLDFQFCDALVNYDIPWNPMRIEQRIGRIDRYGQASQTIAIYNFVTPGTVDFDIFNRCLLRIGVFERAIGGSEAILGEIAGALQAVADDFTLTDEKRQARLQQLADNEIRQVIETDALEEREAELFGVRIERNQIDDDIAQASSRWLEPNAIERLVGLHLERELDVGRNPISGQGPAKSLRLSADARRRLVPPRARGSRLNLAEREWEGWPRGDQQTLALTFDRETANADRDLAFITPVHPLTQAAARSFAGDEEIQVALKVSDPALPAGDHPFAIYQWQMRGLREDAARSGLMYQQARCCFRSISPATPRIAAPRST